MELQKVKVKDERDRYNTLKEYIDRYKSLILQERFFEAHEALEELWFPRRRVKDDLTLTLKGFINGAVSFELYRRGRVENSKRVWGVYKKLTKRLERVDSSDLQNLTTFLENFRESYIKKDS